MQKSINKPADWQQFERLCKKLFGEIWNCPSIKKNGRNGQSQSGVDIYGIPKGEQGYFGIQCKTKDNYTQAKLTKNEIVQEINNARNFAPPLSTLVIATSANKDAEIEAFIRLEDIKNRNANLFAIVYYAWEDLADLIDENRETFQWYVAEQQFRSKHDIVVMINRQQNPCISPQYDHEIRTYKLQQKDYIDIVFEKIFEQSHGQPTNRFIVKTRSSKPTQFNYAWCPITVEIENTGSVMLENWKLIVKLEKENLKALAKHYDGEISGMQASALNISRIHSSDNPIINKEDCSVVYSVISTPLVQRDKREFTFWLLPTGHEVCSIKIEWQVIAKDFSREGTIALAVEPKIFRQKKEIEVDHRDKLKNQEEIYKERFANMVNP